MARSFALELAPERGGFHSIYAGATSRGWQTDRFPPVMAKFVRFHGLHSTANSLFQVVEFEVYR